MRYGDGIRSDGSRIKNSLEELCFGLVLAGAELTQKLGELGTIRTGRAEAVEIKPVRVSYGIEYECSLEHDRVGATMIEQCLEGGKAAEQSEGVDFSAGFWTT